MPRLTNKRKHMRAIRPEGGRPKKRSDVHESVSSEPDIGNSSVQRPPSQQQSPPQRSVSISGNSAPAEQSTPASKGPSRTTLWRRAKKEREMENEGQNELNAEENWEDMEQLVEEKWPRVSKEIRTTVLKRGIVTASRGDGGNR